MSFPLSKTPLFVMLEHNYTRSSSSPLAESKSSEEQYAGLARMLQRVLRDAFLDDPPAKARDLPLTTLFSIAEMVVLSLARSGDILRHVMEPRYAGGYIADHSLNVSFLSCALGMEVGLPFRELAELGVGALLHDIGMLRMGDDTCLCTKTIAPEQQSLIRSHPVLAADFLSELEGELPWLVKTVAQEHFREQGRGYPENDEVIHHYPAIVGIADSFEAMTHNRIYREPVSPADALLTLDGPEATLFARDLREALRGAVTRFPLLVIPDEGAAS